MIVPLPVSEVAACCGATLHGAAGDLPEVTGLAIDSRRVDPGDLFVAILGERFDGHDFVATAFERGAHAALVQRPVDVIGPQLLVADTEAAVAAFAARVREAYSGVLVGITGSAGKTTTKNLLTSILARAGSVLATEGNQNNELGAPLTLARLDTTTEYAVLELGAGKPGDIERLCAFVRPTVAVLLNVGPAHLAQFGSLAAISQTKGALLDGLPPNGLAVINADETWSPDWRKRSGATRCLGYGLGESADYRAVDLELMGFSGSRFVLQTPDSEMAVELSLPGRQGVYNALAAAAVADALGVSPQGIVEGLAEVNPAPGRGSVHQRGENNLLVDDSYNANPMAVRAALDVLATESGRRRLVLGAMLELGEESDSFHDEVGRYAAQLGIEELWVVGKVAAPAALAFGSAARYFADIPALLAAHPVPAGADVTLIKASRGAQLDRVVDAWVVTEGAPC